MLSLLPATRTAYNPREQGLGCSVQQARGSEAGVRAALRGFCITAWGQKVVGAGWHEATREGDKCTTQDVMGETWGPVMFLSPRILRPSCTGGTGSGLP